MEIKEKISQILEQHLEEGKFFVADLKVSLSKVHSKVLILIDTDAGISIDECGGISRKLGLELDEIMPDNYTLEVSSPGIDFPLKSERMYLKNIGRNLKIQTIEGKEIIGKLEAVESQQITITEEKKGKPQRKLKGEEIIPMTILLQNIKESKVIISFK